MDTKDCHGNILNNGDTVMPTKDLKVKWMSKTLKRGTKINKISLTDDPKLIECRIWKTTIYLKTDFFKKV